MPLSVPPQQEPTGIATLFPITLNPCSAQALHKPSTHTTRLAHDGGDHATLGASPTRAHWDHNILQPTELALRTMEVIMPLSVPSTNCRRSG